MLNKTYSVLMIVLLMYSTCTHAQEKTYPSYLELGVTVSGLIHPSVGYWWGQTGLRFSGIYINEDYHEYHFNIGRVLSDSGKVQQGINLLTSWVVGSDPGADYRYAATGVAYSINYKGFFLEIGLAHPWRDEIGNLAHDPIIPCGYFGYIYRFIK